MHDLISIHAPRAGSDYGSGSRSCTGKTFQSTLPVRGATIALFEFLTGSGIFQSTLPVRGATNSAMPDEAGKEDFNPRSPCGERPAWAVDQPLHCRFQSTLPVRGATCRKVLSSLPQIHFNPRSPCGERLQVVYSNGKDTAISIHAPRAGSDGSPPVQKKRLLRISIHAPRAGSDGIRC